MKKVEDDEKNVLSEKKVEDASNSMGTVESVKKKKGKKGKKRNRKKKEEESGDKPEPQVQEKKKANLNNEQFIINGIYNLIKMLGFGAFGEIHLAYDTNAKQLRAIKFEVATQKNPQLKHEYNILEQLNKPESNSMFPPEGIPKVYSFDRMENKFNYMVMEFLGPSLSDLFQFKEKSFSLETVLLLGIQMLKRIEYIHEKGFIHRDIKPENFVIGLNEKSNIIHTIDFGLSKRYKDKNSGQHIQYRENRHLVGTVRYASINAHLGIEQSRRDDIESIGYVLVYFYLGRLPWQAKQDKTKPHANKILEKKLITPPEILCKKMPSKVIDIYKHIVEFSYYFHYCKNLKFEDRPDYTTLMAYFAEYLATRIPVDNPFIFDWFEDKKEEVKRREEEQIKNQTVGLEFRRCNDVIKLKKKASICHYPDKVIREGEETTLSIIETKSLQDKTSGSILKTPDQVSKNILDENLKLLNTPDHCEIVRQNNPKAKDAAINNNNPISNEINFKIQEKGKNLLGMKEIVNQSLVTGGQVIQLVQSQRLTDSQRSISKNSSDSDTERMDDEDKFSKEKEKEENGNSNKNSITKKCNISGLEKSESNYRILNKSSSEKSSEGNKNKSVTENILLSPKKSALKKKGEGDVKLTVEGAKRK